MLSFTLNKTPVTVDVDPDTPLLWVLREQLGLCGTKFGCGVGQCGACTVHLDGQPTRACITVVAGVEGKAVTTIEGLSHPVQEAWRVEQVPQCGYCQSGQLMVGAALIDAHPELNAGATEEALDAAIGAGMTNICRCATYFRISKAMKRVARAQPVPAPPPPPVIEVPVVEPAPAPSPKGHGRNR